VKKTILAILALVALAGGAEWMVTASVRAEPGKLAAALVSLALVLALFVALTDDGFVNLLRGWALRSRATAAALPLLLLVPYIVFAVGTGTWTWTGAGKLTAYILAPTLLLLPDRSRKAERVGWRDFAAMAALAAPVMAGWLTGIWTWPRELYLFRPIYSVIAGAYAFLAVRGLEGVGYKLLWRWGDAKHGFLNFVGFSILGIPLGLALNFIHPHVTSFAPAAVRVFGQSFLAPGGVLLAGNFVLIFAGIYLTIAVPEEFLFRGILQNFLVKCLPGAKRELYGLLIASLVFGASHLHHAPVPNWRYAVLASLAGVFYGNAFRARRRLSASALTHALVDTAWHFWF
jgi:CAAX protease family protein